MIRALTTRPGPPERARLPTTCFTISAARRRVLALAVGVVQQTPGWSILLVEDEPATATVLRNALQASGHRVVVATRGDEARMVITRLQIVPDLILLDLSLPDTDGLILISAFKALTRAPIVIFTARSGILDETLARRLGAQDFIPKPFDLEEFEARITSVMRRAGVTRAGGPSELATFGTLVVDTTSQTVAVGRDELDVTPVEYQLLAALTERPGQTVTRRSLATRLWGSYGPQMEHGLDVHISRLRGKLRRAGPDAPTIVTVRGRGYRLAAEPRRAAEEP
jgi:DNA-binding response OmpR family regulator